MKLMFSLFGMGDITHRGKNFSRQFAFGAQNVWKIFYQVLHIERVGVAKTIFMFSVKNVADQESNIYFTAHVTVIQLNLQAYSYNFESFFRVSISVKQHRINGIHLFSYVMQYCIRGSFFSNMSVQKNPRRHRPSTSPAWVLPFSSVIW